MCLIKSFVRTLSKPKMIKMYHVNMKLILSMCNQSLFFNSYRLSASAL